MTTQGAFGGSGIVVELYDWIRAHIPDGVTILELGSGPVSTQMLSRHYKMISIEHDSRYVDLYDSRYIHAPLVAASSGAWYDPAKVAAGLDGAEYQMLIVDGPIGTENRIGFIENMALFNLQCPVVIDDIQRPSEKLITAAVATATGRSPQFFDQFAIV